VRKYINKKNLNVGYASAVEVLKNREGDCSEHAVLTTALCRAIGIPSKVASGFAYTSNALGAKNSFIPHAWTMVYIKNKWISIDAAMGRFGSGHILIELGNGDPEEFINLVNILGSVKIIEMEISKK
jgi:transglutaminase-like putative cysteine protease